MTELDTTVARVDADSPSFRVMAAGYDDWPCEPIRKLIQKRTRLNVVPIPQTFHGMTAGVTELVVATRGPEGGHATATR